ncbi:HD-GYP domain-containing protein [Streptomyces sp. XD-27]|uniref:HD-GYP domain-containing protein n=1 Tax=Streptomyces sp. XD-27 TaxID=3062779 RepID=UPI0026F43C63|nr:HD domain-containing phosphohydrolase [Streptomyces sp. XD-27]WKX74425.1 metal-dependent phosphohydrolase [Streptomyces sp. XD-27]
MYGAAGALTLFALGWTHWHGVREPGVALAFGALIAVGEALRWDDGPAARGRAAGYAPVRERGGGAGGERGPGAREPAPVAAAGALAYALLGRLGGEPVSHGALQVVAVAVAAGLVGLTPRVALGHPPRFDHHARRVLTVAFAAICFQPLYGDGRLSQWCGDGPAHVLCLLVLLGLTALCDAVLAAALAHARTGWPYAPLLRDELCALACVGSAVCATGVVTALAVAVAGLWALPVVCVPLLLTQHALRRYTDVRATYRQTIASLARSTEIAGYTPAGHARRVAALSGAVGRELGLSRRELTVLEHAALMHDIGQLSLIDPVPSGATEQLPAAEQRRIALLGGAVVRQTGAPAQVAQIVEQQADPYREQPLTARIVRVANAYAELAQAPADAADGPLRAVERLRLATARDFDPAVVAALGRVLARSGSTR